MADIFGFLSLSYHENVSLKWLLILHKEFLNKLSDCCKQNELFLLTNEDKRGTGKTMLKLKTMDKSWNVRFKITIRDPD
ncbi:hypothetical protein CSKR_106732 [Clonorchis sinensis]|uniref:Uncharacterized protein n=1 Tax=Clonorchis sinensis TaxID=79923 RepID=A0A419Q854_CLOSI|nr:hypothetical protein CSKR_106732 [Clonorchis sinensis]